MKKIVLMTALISIFGSSSAWAVNFDAYTGTDFTQARAKLQKEGYKFIKTEDGTEQGEKNSFLLRRKFCIKVRHVDNVVADVLEQPIENCKK